MKLLVTYQTRFSSNKFINKINKSSSNYLLGLFDRCRYLLEDQIVFTDALDMEACHQAYSLERYKWKQTPNHDDEWIFMLSRQGFSVDLAIAYHLTKDQRYLLKWKELVFSFIKKEGVAVETNKKCWRPLDSGLRLTNWLKSLVYLPRDRFTDDEWQMLMEAISYHKYYQKETFVSKYLLSNWGVLALAGVAMADVLDDEVGKNQAVWRWLEEQLAIQFTKEGTHWEQSPMYQHEVMMQFASILQIAETLDVALPFDLREILMRAVRSSYYQADQKDVLLALNDSDAVDFSYVYDFYRGMQLLNDAPSEKWNQSAILIGEYYFNRTNQRQVQNLPAVFCDQEAGLAVIKDQKWYLTCFNGLHGSSHGQASSGSITLNYRQQAILIDSGRYSYRECPERITLNSEKAHNIPSLSNQPGTIISGSWTYQQLTEPVSLELKEFDQGYFIAATWQIKQQDTKEMALVTRRILVFNELDTVLVVDYAASSLADQMENNYHISPDCSLKQMANSRVQGDANNQQFALWSLHPITIGEALHSPVYNQLSKHPLVTSTSQTSDSLLNVMALSFNPDVTIKTAPVRQNNQPQYYQNCLGIACSNGEIHKEVYLNLSDIVHKDKLLVTADGKYFYGKLVVFNGEQRLRIQ